MRNLKLPPVAPILTKTLQNQISRQNEKWQFQNSPLNLNILDSKQGLKYAAIFNVYKYDTKIAKIFGKFKLLANFKLNKFQILQVH